MAYISDNFVRSNGVIDGKWGPIFPNTAETMLNALSGGILVNGNGYGPISAGGGDAYSLWTGTVFGNNQWAYSTLRAIAPATAVLSITAVSGSGSTWTYTY